MVIGIVVEDAGYSGMNFSNPEYGNPGVSGTVFEFLMLIRYLGKYYANGTVMVLHFGENIYPENCKMTRLNSHDEIASYHDKEIDLLVVQNGLPYSFYEKLEENSINTILWAHNYLTGEDVEKINSMSNVKRVVFVGREQYDHYIAHDIIKKSTFIYNMFESKIVEYQRNEKLNPVVTYTGSLIPAKGFHMLAHVWKKVLVEVPNAQLNILGSGKLYDRRAKLGKYGIAEESYENSFIDFILDDKKCILPSVHFLGIMGEEKIDVYKNTMVGVMNPTGVSETFGLSGVEMEACGIPIITRKKYGLLDIVEDGKTGILVNTETELLHAIVRLLKDEEVNRELGDKAKEYVLAKFSPEKIIRKWILMFEDIESGISERYYAPKRNFFNDWKWLMLINRWIRNIFPIVPSLIGWKARKRLRMKEDNHEN